MKLRNKKTGEIGWLYCDHISVPKKMTVFSEDKDLAAPHWDYSSLAELTEEWEDYEEPKEHWCINEFGTPEMAGRYNRESIYDKARKHIGNDFKTEGEAEKAVEKLKAWKRLKECGFEFVGWTHTPITKSLTGYNLHIKAYSDKLADYMGDLQLLFGREE